MAACEVMLMIDPEWKAYVDGVGQKLVTHAEQLDQSWARSCGSTPST